jgi:hypothetical protein
MVFFRIWECALGILWQKIQFPGDSIDLLGDFGGLGGWVEVAFFDDLGGISGVDHEGIKGAIGDAAKAENGSLVDGNARADGGSCANPAIGFDRDRGGFEGEAGIAPVVVSGAEVYVLG